MVRELDAVTVRQEIREFLRERFLYDPQASLDDRLSLLEQGVIDSTGLLELVTWLEESFDFGVNDEEIVPENFDSVDGLCRYVHSRLGD